MRQLIVLLSISVLIAADISCMDMDNNNVDWFIFYKLPKIKDNTNAHIAIGTGFLYLDSNSRNKWSLPIVGMETGDHAVFYTLQHYYQTDKSTTFSIMYNDEFPNSTVWSDTSGHTKGVSVFSQQSGYWLIHSIPKFPSNMSYEYPDNAHTYAQMGICVSFAYAQLNDISQQLFINEPFVYEMSLPTQFAKDFPILSRVQKGLYSPTPPFYRIVQITSMGGQKFTHFAKSGMWGRDLYYDLVAPKLYTNLEVETWQHASNDSANLFSWCSADGTTEVLNVEDVSLPYGIAFSNYYDHSKYAVSFALPGKQTLPWVCIGDINRQEHQMVRAGGTLCISDATLYNLYLPTIKKTYACKGTYPPPNPDGKLPSPPPPKAQEKPWLRVNRMPF